MDDLIKKLTRKNEVTEAVITNKEEIKRVLTFPKPTPIKEDNTPTAEELYPAEENLDESDNTDESKYESKLPYIMYENETEKPFKDIEYAHPNSTISELMGFGKPPDDDAFVIIQDGGVGDAICATPMFKSAKEHYPDKKIVVGAVYAEILQGNPYIDHLYHLGNPGDLFEKWVRPLKHFGSVIKRDIYNACAHKLFPGPLSMIWCFLYGVPFHGDDVTVYLSDDEIDDAKRFLKSFPREVIIIHGTGAKLMFNPGVQVTPNKDWFMDYWQVLVKELTKQYDVVQVGGKEEMQIPGITTYLMGSTSIRQTAALLKNCLTYVGIDSFVAHCGAAVQKPGVVLFGRSNPYIAGHAISKNIWVKDSCPYNDLHCGRPQGYFGDSELFRGVTRPWVCPNRECMRAIKPAYVLSKVHELIKEEKKKAKENKSN